MTTVLLVQSAQVKFTVTLREQNLRLVRLLQKVSLNVNKIQLNKKSKMQSKKETQTHGDSEHVYSWRSIPVSRQHVDRIIEELREWPALHPEAKFIGDFYRSRDLSKATYGKLIDRYPDLKELHTEVMSILGERLLGKAIENKGNWNATKWCLHNYGEEFRENNTYHAKLANEESQNNGPTIVVIEKMPETDIVKRKKLIKSD
jgi:hypothetical protein